MGKCGACGYSHPHPGEKNCRFTKDAKEKCKDAGIEDSRWGEFLDVDTLQELTKSEGDDTGLASYLTVDDLKLLQQSDKDQKDQLFKLQKDVTKLTSQLGSFLSIHGPPVRAPAATAPLAVSTTVGSLTSTVPTTTVAVCMAGGGVTAVTTTHSLSSPVMTGGLTSYSSPTGMGPAGAWGGHMSTGYGGPTPPLPTYGGGLPTHAPASYLSGPLTTALQNLVNNEKC